MFSTIIYLDKYLTRIPNDISPIFNTLNLLIPVQVVFGDFCTKYLEDNVIFKNIYQIIYLS